MDKKEILSKSRNEKQDEGFIYAQNRGNGIGISAFCIVFIIIVIVNIFNGQPNNGPFAMFWAFFGAHAIPQYQFTKNIAYLITAIAGLLASLAFLVSFIIQVIGG